MPALFNIIYVNTVQFCAMVLKLSIFKSYYSITCHLQRNFSFLLERCNIPSFNAEAITRLTGLIESCSSGEMCVQSCSWRQLLTQRPKICHASAPKHILNLQQLRHNQPTPYPPINKARPIYSRFKYLQKISTNLQSSFDNIDPQDTEHCLKLCQLCLITLNGPQKLFKKSNHYSSLA